MGTPDGQDGSRTTGVGERELADEEQARERRNRMFQLHMERLEWSRRLRRDRESNRAESRDFRSQEYRGHEIIRTSDQSAFENQVLAEQFFVIGRQHGIRHL
jgi:hypothetical protein